MKNGLVKSLILVLYFIFYVSRTDKDRHYNLIEFANILESFSDMRLKLKKIMKFISLAKLFEFGFL